MKISPLSNQFSLNCSLHWQAPSNPLIVSGNFILVLLGHMTCVQAYVPSFFFHLGRKLWVSNLQSFCRSGQSVWIFYKRWSMLHNSIWYHFFFIKMKLKKKLYIHIHKRKIQRYDCICSIATTRYSLDGATVTLSFQFNTSSFSMKSNNAVG